MHSRERINTFNKKWTLEFYPVEVILVIDAVLESHDNEFNFY